LNHTEPAVLSPAAFGARDWAQMLARYRTPNPARSIAELIVTAGALILLWSLMWTTLELGYWFCLLLAVPAAGFLVRLFMIQHDCGHGAFFHRRSSNDWVGRLIGVLTLTPYDYWRRKHAIHHATSGNLERRGIGDVNTLTVQEYLARSRWGRLRYRLYRHPLVMFGLGPAYLFIVEHRLPVDFMRHGWMPWLSTMATNVAIAALVTMMICLVGIGPFLLVHLPVILIAASVGVWLFYVQHQFEHTMWAHDGSWNLQDMALRGSSHYGAAEPLALVHRQYRHSPHPSFVQPHPLLPAAGRAARPPGPRRHRPTDPASELRLRAACAMGRRPAASGLVPRRVPASLMTIQEIVYFHL
jgi:acyl-lipid omega-6 desaturase (Delta-12 desaturase)